MNITLQYFDGCPSWETTYARLREVLDELGHGTIEPKLVRIDTQEDAERNHFSGSPTILIDDRDPFAVNDPIYGLACRVYKTAEGLAGSPTKDQPRVALGGV